MSALPAAGLAVLTIDVQVGLFCTQPPPFEAQEVIARINSVNAKARAAGVPVFFVQHDGPPDGNWLVPQSDAWQLHHDLTWDRDDPVIRKTTGDAFYATNLEQNLRDRDIQSIVLMGYASEFCIDSTLRNAASKEFEVFVVSDAHTTNDSPVLQASIIRQFFNWAWSDSSSRRGIQLIKTDEVSFR